MKNINGLDFLSTLELIEHDTSTFTKEDLDIFIESLPETINSYCIKERNKDNEFTFGSDNYDIYDLHKSLKRLKKELKLNQDKKSKIDTAIGILRKEMKQEELLENEKIKKLFAKRLTEIYFAEYDTQKELEEELQVTQQTVNSYLNGQILPSYDKMLKISKFLGCSIDYLINSEVSQKNVYKQEIYEHIGLDARSIDILSTLKYKSPKEFNDISYTLNALVHRLSIVNDLSVDVLTAITDFIRDSNGEGQLHIVSKDTLDMLKDHLHEMKSLEEVSFTFNNFVNVLEEAEMDRRESFADTKILHLKNIEDKLKNVIEDLKKEYIEKQKNR